MCSVLYADYECSRSIKEMSAGQLSAVFRQSSGVGVSLLPNITEKKYHVPEAMHIIEIIYLKLLIIPIHYSFSCCLLNSSTF